MKRPKPIKFRVNEEALQEYAADVIRAFGIPGVLWWHTPNGGYRHPAVANAMKRAGTKPGVPDLLFIVPTANDITYSIKFLELKYGSKGRQSDNQKAFEATCRDFGIDYKVARTVEEIDAVLNEFGVIAKKVARPATPVAYSGSVPPVSRRRSRKPSKVAA